MMKFAFVRGYSEHVPATADNFLAKLALVQQGVLNTNDLFQPLGRDMLRDLMFLDDTLSKMSLVEPLTNAQIGLSDRYNEADTVEVKIGNLRDKSYQEAFKSYMAVIKGAVADPFMSGQDNPGQEGFQQAAVMNLHKARVLVRWMIETMTGLKDL